jgi:hypothetical protein
VIVTRVSSREVRKAPLPRLVALAEHHLPRWPMPRSPRLHPALQRAEQRVRIALRIPCLQPLQQGHRLQGRRCRQHRFQLRLPHLGRWVLAHPLAPCSRPRANALSLLYPTARQLRKPRLRRRGTLNAPLSSRRHRS